MSAFSRDKGAKGELEIAHILQEHGWPDARRTSDGREQALRGDIARGPAGVHIEAKRTEYARPWEWWKQARRDTEESGYDIVIPFRRSRSPWLAIVEFEPLLLPLLALRERS